MDRLNLRDFREDLPWETFVDGIGPSQRTVIEGDDGSGCFKDARQIGEVAREFVA